jgi:nucleoside-diphosphate-sugar epimerase
MSSQKQNILISGSNGFVGSNLVPYLEKASFKITGVSRSPNSKNEISYGKLELPIWNSAYAMIHLAGKAHDLKNVSNESEYFQVNTELTKTLYEQFLQSNCKIFIYMSSVKAICDKKSGILKESHLPNPTTAYGKSKLASEEYLLTRPLPRGKKLYILRPCMIHGPGNKGNLNVLFSMAKKGLPYPFGAYKNERSFLSIDNLSFLLKQILIKKPASGVYHVSDDEMLSSVELYLIMGKVLERKLRVVKIPKSIISLLGLIGDRIPIPMNSHKIEKLTENFRVSNEKIKLNLSVDKLPISARHGIVKTIESFQKEE